MSNRKKSQQAVSTTDRSGILALGLDIGYGVTKAVTKDAAIAFPSVTGHAREIKFNREALAAKYPGDQLSDDDGSTWFVGDLALAQLPPGELLRLRGRTANEQTMGNTFRLRLAKAAIGKLAQGASGRDVVHLRVCTGLPVDHMRDANQLRQALLGQHLIQTDSCEVIANVTEVMVMPQPYGSAYAMMLTDTGGDQRLSRLHAHRRGRCRHVHGGHRARRRRGLVDAESGSVGSVGSIVLQQ